MVSFVAFESGHDVTAAFGSLISLRTPAETCPARRDRNSRSWYAHEGRRLAKDCGRDRKRSVSTCFVRGSNGKVSWWTFAGGIANNLLADALKSNFDVKGDNLAVNFMATPSLDAIAERIDELTVESIKPISNLEAMENLKFSECLSPEIASLVFLSRFSDPAALAQAISEPMRHVVL